MYNRVRTPKFYIDAVLLARQLGYIETENAQGKYYLNPTKTTDVVFSSNSDVKFIGIDFKNRYFLNSLTHCFILGHQLATDNIQVLAKSQTENINGVFEEHLHTGNLQVSTNGWTKLDNFTQYKNINLKKFVIRLESNAETSTSIGDISIGWSYEMPHSPDMELTQTFANESLKTVNTKSGVTLSNVGWNQPPMWGTRPAWRHGSNFVSYPARRSWSLKFSYLADENTDNSGLMPQHYNKIMTPNSNNIGIFERSFGEDDEATGDVDESTFPHYNIKQDFLSKVMPTINLGLPFIFQPDSEEEEYAIARVNANSVTMNQVANNVYDIGLDIVEVW